MALILLGFEHLPVLRDTRRANAMRHQNSVLHGLLKLVPWSVFERLVDEHRADARIRQLSTKSQFVSMLYSQLSGAQSLREIETALSSHSGRLYHLGAKAVSRSTLADANALRPWQVFHQLFAHMAGQAGRNARRQIGQAVRLIDATGVRLAGIGVEWAHFSTGVFGVKAHVIYDPDADRPLYLEVTNSRVNDITAAKAMPIEPGATYVFDLGYYDYGWWSQLDQAGCRFVTRLKTNTPLRQAKDLPLDEAAADILSDQIGFLPERLCYSRRNPFHDPVRVVRVVIDTGKILRIVTNDLDASAREIADLYKRRWAVELFFRWVKQTLKIKHFVGRSENAVRIQIAVALIAYLLLRQAQDLAKTTPSPLAFARLVRANLMHRRDLGRLLAPDLPVPLNPRQLCLDWGQP
jgi:hypothetical protein